MNDDAAPNLKNTSTDLLASLAKAATGMIPVPIVGSLVAELIGNIIPNQRVDRIVRFVELLEQRLGGLEQETLRSKFLAPPVVDILEDAFTQAARATTQDRLNHIADVVANGMSADTLDQAQIRRMLWLLAQLTDEEVVILRSKLAQTRESFEQDSAFRQTHEKLLAPDSTHMGSSDAEFEDAALKASYRQHLLELGLVRNRYQKVKRGELPEFDDKTGTLKPSGTDLTRLGKMLLRYLSLIPSWYQH